MKHRLEQLAGVAKRDGRSYGNCFHLGCGKQRRPYFGSQSREAGHHCAEIYFKDWLSNHLDPATDIQLDNLVKVIRREQLNLVCISIRVGLRRTSTGVDRVHPK